MPEPAGRTRRPKLLFVEYGSLDDVTLDEVEREHDEVTLADKLQPPIGDFVISSLRNAYSDCYRFNLAEIEFDKFIQRVRRAASSALADLGEQLDILGLNRIDSDDSFEHDHSAKVFLLSVIRPKDLRMRVTVEETGNRKWLSECIESEPADDAIRALRAILSITFHEVHTPKEQRQLVHDIRLRTATVLVPLNRLVEDIDLEPVAAPTRVTDDLES